MSPPDDGPQRPGVYARLAEQAEIERAVRAGELSAVDGTARILRLFTDDLTRARE